MKISHTKLINNSLPYKQFNFKNFIVTIALPIVLLTLVHQILFAIGTYVELAIWKINPNYQFNVWLPMDNFDWSKYFNAQRFFWYVYATHLTSEMFLPIIVAMVCGRQSFNTYIKCASICYTIGFVIFLVFPTYNYLNYGFYKGPSTLPNDLRDLPHDPYNVRFIASYATDMPSFHLLVPLCVLAGMCFVKLDQPKFNKTSYYLFLSFVLFYILLTWVTVIIVKQHYFIDTLVSLGIAMVVFSISWFVNKKKNGIYIANVFEQIYLYVDKNSAKHKTQSYTVFFVICLLIILLTISQALFGNKIWELVNK